MGALWMLVFRDACRREAVAMLLGSASGVIDWRTRLKIELPIGA